MPRYFLRCKSDYDRSRIHPNVDQAVLIKRNAGQSRNLWLCGKVESLQRVLVHSADRKAS
jgi:hypothetical protein